MLAGMAAKLIIECQVCGTRVNASSGKRKYCTQACKSKAAYLRDPDKARMRARDYRRRNGEAIRARDRDSYAASPDAKRMGAYRWYWGNRDRALKRSSQYRAENRAEFRRRNAAYYRANKAAFIEAARRREVAVRAATVSPFSADDLAARLSMFPHCWICGAAGVPMHVDHVKPISKGGPHMLSNLRNACAPCNLSKSNKWPFYPREKEMACMGNAPSAGWGTDE